MVPYHPGRIVEYSTAPNRATIRSWAPWNNARRWPKRLKPNSQWAPNLQGGGFYRTFDGKAPFTGY